MICRSPGGRGTLPIWRLCRSLIHQPITISLFSISLFSFLKKNTSISQLPINFPKCCFHSRNNQIKLSYFCEQFPIELNERDGCVKDENRSTCCFPLSWLLTMAASFRALKSTIGELFRERIEVGRSVFVDCLILLSIQFRIFGFLPIYLKNGRRVWRKVCWKMFIGLFINAILLAGFVVISLQYRNNLEVIGVHEYFVMMATHGNFIIYMLIGYGCLYCTGYVIRFQDEWIRIEDCLSSQEKDYKYRYAYRCNAAVIISLAAIYITTDASVFVRYNAEVDRVHLAANLSAFCYYTNVFYQLFPYIYVSTMLYVFVFVVFSLKVLLEKCNDRIAAELSLETATRKGLCQIRRIHFRIYQLSLTINKTIGFSIGIYHAHMFISLVCFSYTISKIHDPTFMVVSVLNDILIFLHVAVISEVGQRIQFEVSSALVNYLSYVINTIMLHVFCCCFFLEQANN